jgi:leucyl aminopeptidase
MSVQFTATTADATRAALPLLAVVLPSDAKLPRALNALDRSTKGALSLAIKRGDFTGAKDESLLVVNPGPGPQRVLLVGSGTGDTKGVTRAATLAGRKANALNVGSMGLWAEDLQGERVEGVVVGVSAGSWEFRELMAAPTGKPRKPLTAARIFVENMAATKAAMAAGIAVAEGQRVARRLAMLPSNVCTPSFLADTSRDIAKRLGMKVSVLGRKEMEKLKMGSFLAVAQGTTQDPKLIVLEYQGGRRGEAPVALVGKGLCFDTGGVSIKPAPGMELMKFDMSGAAGVIGAMEAIGRLKPTVNVVALVGATTNVVDADAVRPGDVVRAGDGTTIEIQNTDAEGRLVLADVLHYAKRYKPQAVVDAATLTGAVVIALGNVTFGVMGNDQATVDDVLAASRRGGELAWQLPLFEEYKEQLKSDVADLRNIGGRGAGTITAGLFLQHFAGEMKWVHLDVAGTAYSETDLVVLPKGPTGVPVRTFVEFVRGRAR